MDALSSLISESKMVQDLTDPSSPFLLFFEGDPYYANLRQAILTAKTSIEIEIYYLASDDIGWEFASLLRLKAEEGVTVRLVYDAVGCQRTSQDLFDSMTEKGVQVRPYHPVYQRFRKLLYRNHRKLVIIDEATVFLGGFNLASEYSVQYSQENAWRDTGIRMDHPKLAKEAMEIFKASWKEKGFNIPRLFKRLPRRKLESPSIVGNYGLNLHSPIRHNYLTAIRQAKKEVWITNAYFVPDRGVLRCLRHAAMQGKDVRLLTAGKTDVRLVRWAGRATYFFLLKAGVRIYEYQPRVLHAKSAIIDEKWFTIGTTNLDHISFFRNLEVNLVAEDKNAADLLKNQFEADLHYAKEITWADWKKRSLLYNLFYKFCYLFRAWL